MRAGAGIWTVAIFGGALFSTSVLGAAPRTLSDGLVLQEMAIDGDQKATVLRVNLEKFDVRVLAAQATIGGANPERAARGYFLKDYARFYRAAAVLAGGYIADFSPPTPLGLIKSNGAVVSRPHNSWLTEGAFCSDAGRALIEPFGDTTSSSSYRDCLQAGPLLLLDGTQPTNLPSVHSSGYPKLAKSVQQQTFVCTLSDDEVALGVTEAVNLPALISFLKGPDVGCIDAIRLTGKETSGLAIGTEIFGKDNIFYPSAIAVIPR